MAEIEIPVVEMVPINDLKIDGKNPNKMTPTQERALDESIKKYGFIVPIITNKDLLIADGEQKWLRAKVLGMKQVPVIRLLLKDIDRRILRQVLNKLRGTHDWEMDILEFQFFSEHMSLGEVNELLALKEREFDSILDALNIDKEEEFDVEKEYKKIETDIVRGDVFRLDQHRLICGDATSPEDTAKLMNGNRAKLVFTDPPYNINYRSFGFHSYAEGKYKYGHKEVFQDNMTEEQYLEFLRKAMKNCFDWTTEKAGLVLWNGDKHLHTAIQAVILEKWKVNQLGAWVKNSLTYAPGCVFHKQLEFYILGLKEGKKPELNKQFVKNRTSLINLEFSNFLEQLDAWYQHRDKTSEYEHPTQKPYKLAFPAIMAMTERSEIVLDLFGGSGSTLIAAEKLSRQCFMMELDPKYCQIIINRWERYTGKTAKKAAEVKGDVEQKEN